MFSGHAWSVKHFSLGVVDRLNFKGQYGWVKLMQWDQPKPWARLINVTGGVGVLENVHTPFLQQSIPT